MDAVDVDEDHDDASGPDSHYHGAVAVASATSSQPSPGCSRRPTATCAPAAASSTPSPMRAPNASHMLHVDWQSNKSRLSERGKHLLDTGLWADCHFIVGIQPNVKIFNCHRMFLAMSSPVFEAMFYGGLAEKDEVINILDVQPEAFNVLLEYIYTDEINLNSFELVCDICYAAKKYMLPALVEECTKYLWRDLYPRNACRAYEFAKLFEEPVLMDKSLQIIRTQTREVLAEVTFEDIEHSTLCVVLSQDTSSAHESELFDAMVRWADRETERRHGQSRASSAEPMQASSSSAAAFSSLQEKRRAVLGDALFLIRFLTFTAAEFAAGPAKSGLLTQEESFATLMNISAPGSWEMPDHMSGDCEPRRSPRVGATVSIGTLDTTVDMSVRYYCKRAIMQEPHCLNTSILDCSVTFTVDKDICIHGIEVPSQVTDIPENPPLELPSIPVGQADYNELLYAHLLDADGNRLTYTHFTAKCMYNSMIEITFNRSVYIKANKVYRIGMVLNKVGWYPTGVCTRRVNCEGCFFTYCVGQPNDTLRDGLIRSIIFSK